MGSATSAEFAAAVSNEGGLGGIGSLFRTTDAIKRDIDTVRELTNRHFAVNHVPQTLDKEAFRHTLAARPAVNHAGGRPGEAPAILASLVARSATARLGLHRVEARSADDREVRALLANPLLGRTGIAAAPAGLVILDPLRSVEDPLAGVERVTKHLA